MLFHLFIYVVFLYMILTFYYIFLLNYKNPNNKMAESGAHQSQLSTAFNYLNDNFCCENTPVHQIVVSYLCFLLFKSETVL